MDWCCRSFAIGTDGAGLWGERNNHSGLPVDGDGNEYDTIVYGPLDNIQLIVGIK